MLKNTDTNLTELLHLWDTFNKTQAMLDYIAIYRVFREQADWTLTHTNHKDIEHSTIVASIALDGVTLTHCSRDHRMNDLQFAERYQCLSIRYSGRLISLQNEHYT
jgi:hypothetical protein